MKTLFFAILVAGLVVGAGWRAVAQPPPGQPAPDITGGGPWVNGGPLTLAGLRGRVVLIDFWTYG